MSEYLQRMAELESQMADNFLPDFPVSLSRIRGFKRHKMRCGESQSWDLVGPWGLDISLALWYNSAGTEFPVHAHESSETITVLSGSMLFTQIGEGAIVGTQPVEYQQEARLIKGDSITIASGVMHAARFLEDTWYTAFLPIVDPDWPSWGK